jgi:hypothetical protein
VKAHTLKEAYNIFDPTPLEESNEPFYIQRGENLVKLFSTFDQTPIKVLFSGHRGSGKTTELNYTAKALATKYTVLNLKVGKYLESKKFDFPDILKAILGAAGGFSSLRKAMKMIAEGVISFYGFPVNISENMRRNDYLSALNNVVKTLQKKTGKNVLLLIDDLDKFTSRVENVLLEEGQAFNEIACSLVLTVPITLFYSPMINRITDWFPHTEILPNIQAFDKDGKIFQPGTNVLKELVLRRMDPALITGKALERAVVYSGGVFRYLVKLIQDSSFSALMAKENKISGEHIDGSITRMRSEFGRIIGLDDYDTLKKIHKQKNLTNIHKDVRFIANDIVLEYQNKTRWVDIHPIVIDLLPAD